MMIRITIAEPAGFPPGLTGADAPLWQDGHGNLYRVASGLTDSLPDGAWQMPDSVAAEGGGTGMPPATPEAAVIVAGVEGLEALPGMGLFRLGDTAGPGDPGDMAVPGSSGGDQDFS